MSIVVPFGAFFALLLVFVPAFWIASRLSVRTSTPTVWLRRLLVSLWGVASVSYAILLAFGVGDLAQCVVVGYTPILRDSMIGDFASQLAITLAAGGVTVGTYASIVPAIRDAREMSLTVETALVRLGRYAVAFAGVLSVVFVLFSHALAAGGHSLYWLFLLGLIGVLSLVNVRLVHLFRSTRSPDTAERDRLRRLTDQVGLSVEAIVVLEDADETAEMHVRGVPTRRHLFVSEYLLETFDDETIRTMCAIYAGRARTHQRGITVYPLLGYLVIAVGTLLWGSGRLVTVVLLSALVLPLPTLWAGRRAFYRADDYASTVVGAETVAESLERLADEQHIDVVRGGIWRVFRSRPPLGRRISRLKNRSSAPHSEV